MDGTADRPIKVRRSALRRYASRRQALRRPGPRDKKEQSEGASTWSKASMLMNMKGGPRWVRSRNNASFDLHGAAERETPDKRALCGIGFRPLDAAVPPGGGEFCAESAAVHAAGLPEGIRLRRAGGSARSLADGIRSRPTFAGGGQF